MFLYKRIWFIPTLLMISATLWAQEGSPVLRENDRGEKIIVYPDGRWQYFHQYNQGSKMLFDPQDAPGDDQHRQALERYPVFTGKVVPFKETIPITEEDAQKIAFRKSQLARSAVAITEERAQKATDHRQQLEADLERARRQGADPTTVHRLEKRLQAAIESEETTRREASLAYHESERAELFVERGNYLDQMKAARQRESQALESTNAQSSLTGSFYDQIAYLDKGIDRPSRQFYTVVHPPAPACRLAFDGLDEYTGMHRRDVQKQLLFTHTDDRLRLYLKDKDYLRCEGFITSLAGGYRYLSLEFTFAYPNAREAYGFIEKGSYLVIKMMDGQSVYLQSGKMDQGSYDTKKELLTYRVHYPMNQSVINSLKKREVDSIRMYWSSGFEEYEVYYLDFFKDQISCLESNR